MDEAKDVPRSVQVLWLLEANPQGLRVLDVMAHFDESARLHRTRWGAALAAMKRDGRVLHVQGARGAGRAGRARRAGADLDQGAGGIPAQEHVACPAAGQQGVRGEQSVHATRPMTQAGCGREGR